MKTAFGRSGVIALSALCIAAACRAKEGSTVDTSAAAAGAAVAPETSGSAAAATPAAGAQGLTDANIVYILDQANASDSARGRLAESKGTSADVKSFGRLMAGEHHALREQGQKLASKLGVTPQPPAGDQSEAQAGEEMSKLQAEPKGKGWDKSYIDYEVTYHQAVIETATKALDAAQNQELKDLIKQAAPVLQHHLDRAREIQKQLGS